MTETFLCLFFNEFFGDWFALTALPIRMTQFQVTASTSWILLGPIWTANALNLVVKRFQGGINLNVMLAEIAGSLVSTHVTERIGSFLSLTQTSKSRHINARARRTRGTRWTRCTSRTLIKYARIN